MIASSNTRVMITISRAMLRDVRREAALDGRTVSAWIVRTIHEKIRKAA